MLATGDKAITIFLDSRLKSRVSGLEEFKRLSLEGSWKCGGEEKARKIEVKEEKVKAFKDRWLNGGVVFLSSSLL